MNKQYTISFVTLVFLISCLLSLSQATPLTDISSNSIAITRDTAERLVVSIERVDDLIDDDGALLAQRISAVIMDFELKDDHFLLNSVPVKLGVKGVEVVNALVVPAGVKEDDIHKYNENFDIGLVKVEVNTKVESMNPLRKITVTIGIIEINGVKISSTNTVGRVWEFKLLEIEDGDQNSEILPIPPVDDDSSLSLSHKPCSSSLKSLSRRIRHWWRCSSRYIRIFIASLVLTAVFGVFLLLVSIIANAVVAFISPKKFTKYQKVLQEDENGNYMYGEVEHVIFVADEYKLES